MDCIGSYIGHLWIPVDEDDWIAYHLSCDRRRSYTAPSKFYFDLHLRELAPNDDGGKDRDEWVLLRGHVNMPTEILDFVTLHFQLLFTFGHCSNADKYVFCRLGTVSMNGNDLGHPLKETNKQPLEYKPNCL